MSSSSSSGGIGFVGLLQVLFIGLKLTNYVTWSWWWIMSPVWICTIIIVIVLIVVFIIAIVTD